MLKKRKVLLRFFLTYVTIVVPVLLASMFATGVIQKEMLKMEDELLHRQLKEVKDTFAATYINYYDEGIIIGSRTELLPNKMLGHPNNIQEGIDILKLKSNFDDDIIGVFVTYETDKVYSSTGITRKTVYFSSSLNCTEESIRRGMEAIESEKGTVTLLFDKRAGGKILYSYKIYRSSDASTSVNFVMDFSQLEDMVHISNENQYYELIMADGSFIVICCDENGEIIFCESELWEELTAKKQFTVFEEYMEESGITIRLYYDKKDASIGWWLYKIQTVNIVLILLGITWSVIFSWLYSRKQMREITLLEKTAKGEAEDSLPSKNVYHDLQGLILQGFNENRKLEESVLEHKERLQDKVINMVFHGMFHEPEKLEIAFRELGFVSVPKRFFVGAVSVECALEQKFIEEILGKCLWMSEVYEGKDIIIYLYEMQMEDENQFLRKKYAEEIRRLLHQKGIHKIRIGMSQVYSNPVIIDCAYAEAIQMLGRLLQGKEKDYYLCWDNTNCQKILLMPDESLMEEFEQALQEKYYEDAVQAFHQLLYSSMVKECTEQNRNYIRYEILQKLIQYLKEEKTMDKQLLLEECINIRVEHEREFTNAVSNILQKVLQKKENDSFAVLLEYINQNYQNSSLTYEEVAAAGGISKNYISKMFRVKLGMSYIEYLTLVRLDKASDLLRTTDININTVAEMVGYANTASFRRAFKVKYGLSASDYRNKERKYQGKE